MPSRRYTTPALEEMTRLLNQIGNHVRPKGNNKGKPKQDYHLPPASWRGYNEPPQQHHAPPNYYRKNVPPHYNNPPPHPYAPNQKINSRQMKPQRTRPLPIIPLVRKRGGVPGGGSNRRPNANRTREGPRRGTSAQRNRGGNSYRGPMRADNSKDRRRNSKRKPSNRNKERKEDVAVPKPIEYNPMAVTIRPKRPKQVVGMHSSTKGWKLVLRDNQRQCFSSYLQGAFKKGFVQQWFKMINSKVNWQCPKVETNTARGKVNLLTRSVAWFANCDCMYSYSGVCLKPELFPPWLTEISKAVMAKVGIKDSNTPNSCLVNLYPDGSGYVDWHSDREAIFIPENEDNVLIISLSLGAPRLFEMRFRKNREWSQRDIVRKLLRGGDLITMEGQFQRHYVHRVPRDEQCTKPRINLTWRWIRSHLESCKHYKEVE